MNKNRLDSLITLLDDPDDSVFMIVLEEMIKEDISIVDRLEHIWETSLDDIVQQRIETIIQQIQLNDTKEKIRNWSNQKIIDLFEGFFLISRYQYPELKLKSILIQLENIRKEIWLEFRNSLTSLEKITIMNHIFFRHYKFSLDKTTPNSPQNCYINRILDTRKGNPISITILYMLIARSLNLPVYYIDFQEHPLIGYFDKDIAQLANEKEVDHSVLFYINASHKGAVIGPNEVDYILQTSDPEKLEKLTQACPDRTIIKRLVEKLASTYNQIGSTDKVFYLIEIAGML